MVVWTLTLAVSAAAPAQSAPATSTDLAPQTLPLTDLRAFRAPTPGWKIVGGASTVARGTSSLETTPGSGVLVHLPTSTARSTLQTSLEHGDLDLSFDVMSSRGSKASVLLMGRYGVELSDSWADGAPRSATIGAIRWSDSRGQAAAEGTAPRMNAGRAPGLWQHVDIVFRAPKFNAGQQVASARFARVTVNGVVVQENVMVAAPTLPSADGREQGIGPLAFEAGGALAIRNIQYKAYTNAVALSGLRYRVYEGDAMDASFASSHAPAREGTASSISPELQVPQDKFAVAYEGTMMAPTSGRYRFGMSLGWIGNDSATRGASIGGGMLSVDGKSVVNHTGADRRTIGDVDLAAGSHAIALTYYKNRPQFNRRDVAISVEGPGVERQSLNDDGGTGGGAYAPVNPIMLDVQAEPVLLRGFVRHRSTKRVIAISVADPRGVHYTYDLAQGALLYVWRGPFLETTQMWHERGEDQTAEPVGSTVTMPGPPAVAQLANTTAVWPDSLDDRALHRDGYQLDKSGHPTFLYHVRGVSVEDAIRPDPDGLSLRREIRLQAPPDSGTMNGFHVQLAQASHIERQRDGSYVVGDRTFYVMLPSSSGRPVLRRTNGMDELLLPVRFTRGASTVAYSIVW